MFPLQYRTKCNDHNTSQPWMIESLLKQCKTKNQLHKLAIRGNISWKTYATLRNKLSNLIRKQKNRYFYTSVEKHKNNSSAIWKIINKCVGRETNTSFNSDLSADQLEDFFYLG